MRLSVMGVVMPDGVLIRQLSAHDVDLFRALLLTFGRAFEDVDTYASAQPSDEYMERLLAGEQIVALAALQDGAVIGGLAAYELRKFEQERIEFYIYDLAVDAAQRGRGVAAALIDELKAVGKARGAYVIFVQADRADAAAIALYSKYANGEDVLQFDIAID